jgi:transmembrane sensor
MNSNQVEIEAGEWLARLDRDEPSPADLAGFDRWKEADPRNAGAYARLAATWQALDRIRAIRPGADEPIDNDYLNAASSHFAPQPIQYSVADSAPDAVLEPVRHAIENVARDSLAHHLQPLPQKSSARRPWLFLSVAASLTVAVACLWIAHAVSGPKTFSTGIGGFQRIVLEDQSAIELNTDTEVRVSLSPRVRRVELVRGEASFEVAHDASRPFIVSAGNTAVRAVGTKFDVRRLDNTVEVTVDEGKVVVGDPSVLESKADLRTMSIPQLTAGQSALATGNGVQLKQLPKRDMERKLAWQNQMLVFDGDTLAEVVAQFNRYNGRQLVIADPSLATLHISGYFRPTNLDAFISVLQSDFDIRMSMDGNRLVLVPVKIN